ncbi:MAG: DUF4157 domain-containing protein [Burkholderiaceae bacterium]|nr:DUF4157 domain-containing protein [Burkholderiaceae bacterium]
MPQARQSATAVRSPRRTGTAPARARKTSDVADAGDVAGVADRRPSTLAQLAQREAIDRGPRLAAQRAWLAGLRGDAAPPAASGRVAALPAGVKAGVEALSGLAMDSVRVHHDSALPQRLGALACAQGRDIHLAPGQERELPHEAWHVVQQAQGRVAPTSRQRDGTPLNDDPALEREADAMAQRVRQPSPHQAAPARHGPPAPLREAGAALQRKVIVGFEPDKATEYKRGDAKALLKILEEVDAGQLGHAGFARHDAQKRLLIVRDFISRDTVYAMRQVKETRIDPKSQTAEPYWWKFSVGDKADYALYSYEAWAGFFDTLFGGKDEEERKAPSDAMGAVVVYDGTEYREQTPFVAKLVEDFDLNESTVKTALGRMIGGGKGSGDLRRSGPAVSNDTALAKLQSSRHESFGMGENGCTFFFLKTEEAITVVAVGQHKRDAKHYTLVYGATGYPPKGGFEFP